MSDDERLKAIDRIHKDMEDKLSFLGRFNGDVEVLILQRAKEKSNIEFSRKLQGLNR